MIKHTFQHIPGIGECTEQRFWAQGFVSWQDCLGRCECCPAPPRVRSCLAETLYESARALSEGNAQYFGQRLPASELWRLYPEFQNRTAFLDIETTGLFGGGDAITVIGLFNGHETKQFIKGINLQQFAQEIEQYSLLVTFNGKRFDLPFIEDAFGITPSHIAHLDLMYPLKKLGYRGGLKSIENQLGVEREGALKKVSGFMAVLLWREYQLGNRAALDTLSRYNMEDVVNLQYLADIAYNKLAANLPLKVDPLVVRPKYVLDTPFDEELVSYLQEQSYHFGF